MKAEYKKRMEAADDAAEIYFNEAQSGGIDKLASMLENDGEIIELYMKAFDVASDASEEEKDWYFNMTDYRLYKAVLLINSGLFEKRLGGRKNVTAMQMKPMYDALTDFIDCAIEQNDRYKQDYIQRKNEVIEEFNEELSKRGITVTKGGCYIATAVYGSYDCPQVWVLRRFRDNALGKCLAGRLFIRFYYLVSPQLVRHFGNKKWFTRIFRGILDKKVARLYSKGYEDTPYNG